ncbi:MAG: amidohydrolase [Clostridium cadaveris]|uniref:Amidohydrolase n=1 Tax=Clostridium cadaveris TaxID=1529 RepID=A0A316M1Y5_9CLOT|nr:MAG: amidohydrolase [Clostridium cadaveris]
MREIFVNGQVYTVTNGMKEAFVLEDGRFIYVGKNEGALEFKEEESTITDLNGKFVTAGFNDSHMHLVGYGYSLQMIKLGEHTSSLKDMKDAIREFIESKNLRQNEWIRGRGWNHDYFTDENRFPNRYDLDEITTEYPICIIRACGHACVVNSKALEIIGITKDTPQVEGGQFDIDENGEPLGIFRENALNMIYDNIPVPSKEEIKDMIVEASSSLNSYGVTSVQTDDFIVFPTMDYEVIIESFKELESEGRLNVKVYEQAQLVNLELLKEFIEKGYNTGFGSSYFKIGPLKLLGDGSLGARTAYLSSPYEDDPSTSGISVYTQEQFDEMIGYAHANGMQVAVHAIGDEIMVMIVEAIEKALKKNPREDHRHGIVHCQITTKDLINKFKELDLHAYVQSIFLDYDINIVEDRIGKERVKTTYNFKTLMNNGTKVSNGSDCPVELPNVLNGIQCAVTRMNLEGTKGPFLNEEALSVEEAIQSYTTMAAHSSFEENIKGSIECGKCADFVVLDRNLLNSDLKTIKDIKVLETYVDGKCVYRK